MKDVKWGIIGCGGIAHMFASSLQALESGILLAGENKLFMMEAVWTRVLPAIRKMQALLAEGIFCGTKGYIRVSGFLWTQELHVYKIGDSEPKSSSLRSPMPWNASKPKKQKATSCRSPKARPFYRRWTSSEPNGD